MKNLRRTLTVGAAVLGLSTLAGATTLTYNSSTNPATVNIADRNTNFSTIYVKVPYFDSAAVCTSGYTCTLNSVYVSLTGDVSGSAKFESLDAAPTTVTTNVSANVVLSRPAGGTIVISFPDATASTSVTAYDGNIDFGGASGRTLSGLTNTETEAVTLTSAADLALFTGSGLFSLPVSATATSNATGSGNLITQFGTQAGAAISVTYDYTQTAISTTPEPATFALFGGALVGIGLLRKRTRR